MKICKNCSREFSEREDDSHSPMVELGKIFLEHTTNTDATDYCPECREELGMLNVAGFESYHRCYYLDNYDIDFTDIG